jgi:peptide/nickel transport system permease protein
MPTEPATTTAAAPGQAPGTTDASAPLSPGLIVWRKMIRNPRTIAALALVLLMIFMALSANFIAPHSYKEQVRGSELKAPSTNFVFGTDDLGRDVLSRVMYGSQISMLVGLCATGLSLLIGVVIGLVSGYFGGKVDALLMRATDTVAAFPSLLLAVAITAIFERGPAQPDQWLITQPAVIILFIALGVVGWTGIARLVRSQVLSIKTLDYVSAARALGASNTRIMFRHVLPNCISPIIVVATLAVGGNILGEAGLSFLGLGIQDPFPSWGGMLSTAQGYFRDSWWVAVFPGLAIVATVLSFNLLGDGLRDAMDPKKSTLS